MLKLLFQVTEIPYRDMWHWSQNLAFIIYSAYSVYSQSETHIATVSWCRNKWCISYHIMNQTLEWINNLISCYTHASKVAVSVFPFRPRSISSTQRPLRYVSAQSTVHHALISNQILLQCLSFDKTVAEYDSEMRNGGHMFGKVCLFLHMSRIFVSVFELVSE